VYLIADDENAAGAAVRDLAMIGLDRVAGILGTESLGAWTSTGRTLETVTQLTPSEAAARLERSDVEVIDVRGRTEWEAGHLPGVQNIPLGYLAEHLDELPGDRMVVLQCQGGGRSSIAAALLQSRGMKNVANLAGGYSAWQNAGLPVARDDASDREGRQSTATATAT
jgi:hydroxyacylglutathione hydrolase